MKYLLTILVALTLTLSGCIFSEDPSTDPPLTATLDVGIDMNGDNFFNGCQVIYYVTPRGNSWYQQTLADNYFYINGETGYSVALEYGETWDYDFTDGQQVDIHMFIDVDDSNDPTSGNDYYAVLGHTIDAATGTDTVTLIDDPDAGGNVDFLTY